jgi:hypothetical protein
VAAQSQPNHVREADAQTIRIDAQLVVQTPVNAQRADDTGALLAWL